MRQLMIKKRSAEKKKNTQNRRQQSFELIKYKLRMDMDIGTISRGTRSHLKHLNCSIKILFISLNNCWRVSKTGIFFRCLLLNKAHFQNQSTVWCYFAFRLLFDPLSMFLWEMWVYTCQKKTLMRHIRTVCRFDCVSSPLLLPLLFLFFFLLFLSHFSLPNETNTDTCRIFPR